MSDLDGEIERLRREVARGAGRDVVARLLELMDQREAEAGDSGPVRGLKAKVKSGAVQMKHVELAARLGHEAAREVTGIHEPLMTRDRYGDKVAARWGPNKRELPDDLATLVQWLSDCAEHVLPRFEGVNVNDLRPRRAIEAVRLWLADHRRRRGTSVEISAGGQDLEAVLRVAGEDAWAAYQECRVGPGVAFGAQTAILLVIHKPSHIRDVAAHAADNMIEASATKAEARRREYEWQGRRLAEILLGER